MSAPNKSAMLQLPKEKKWQIYCSQRLVQQQQEMGCLKSNGGGIVGIQETRAASDGNISDPEFYIEKIKALAMVRIFQSLSFGCCFFWGNSVTCMSCLPLSAFQSPQGQCVPLRCGERGGRPISFEGEGSYLLTERMGYVRCGYGAHN